MNKKLALIRWVIGGEIPLRGRLNEWNKIAFAVF